MRLIYPHCDLDNKYDERRISNDESGRRGEISHCVMKVERRSINDDESGRRGEISHYDDERWKKKRDISPTMRLK